MCHCVLVLACVLMMRAGVLVRACVRACVGACVCVFRQIKQAKEREQESKRDGRQFHVVSTCDPARVRLCANEFASRPRNINTSADCSSDRVVQCATLTHTRWHTQQIVCTHVHHCCQHYPLNATHAHCSRGDAPACSLEENRIGDAGAVALGQGLMTNTALRVLMYVAIVARIHP